MRLSSMADYAVVTMCAASRQAGSARVSAGELAGQAGLPVPTVQKLVSLLVRAGLLDSTRGAHGGLRLARPAEAISLADIVEAVEGPIALTACVESARGDCALEASCTVRPHWNVVNDALRTALDDVPLARLATPVTAQSDPAGTLPASAAGRLSAATPAAPTELPA